MIYDLHTLQNRFYFGGNANATLHSAFPLMIEKIKTDKSINCVAFPDDGAQKRYQHLFQKYLPEIDFIVCGKKRDADDPSIRKIVINDGDAKGKNILIVDDMFQSGGTMTVCAKKLIQEGAISVSGFCTHAILPRNAQERFISGDRSGVFKKLFVTNTFPTTTDQLPSGGVFEVLDISEQVLKDL